MSDFQIRLRRRGISRDEILEDLRRVARERGSATVTRLEYDQYGQFGATTALRNFSTWNTAVQAAGLEVANRQDIANEELFENIAAVWTHLGKQPFGRHMSDPSTGSKFSTGTYEKRFGSWNGALVAFAASLSGNGEPTGNPSVSSAHAGSVARRTSRDINWRMRAKV